MALRRVKNGGWALDLFSHNVEGYILGRVAHLGGCHFVVLVEPGSDGDSISYGNLLEFASNFRRRAAML
jgi:hypothetical protein